MGSAAGACWAAHWVGSEQEESPAVEGGAQPHLSVHLAMQHKSHIRCVTGLGRKTLPKPSQSFALVTCRNVDVTVPALPSRFTSRVTSPWHWEGCTAIADHGKGCATPGEMRALVPCSGAATPLCRQLAINK